MGLHFVFVLIILAVMCARIFKITKGGNVFGDDKTATSNKTTRNLTALMNLYQGKASEGNNNTSPDPSIGSVDGKDPLTAAINTAMDNAEKCGIRVNFKSTEEIPMGVNSRFCSMVSVAISNAVDSAARSFTKEVDLEILMPADAVLIRITYPTSQVTDNDNALGFLVQALNGSASYETEERFTILTVSVPMSEVYQA